MFWALVLDIPEEVQEGTFKVVTYPPSFSHSLGSSEAAKALIHQKRNLKDLGQHDPISKPGRDSGRLSLRAHVHPVAKSYKL